MHLHKVKYTDIEEKPKIRVKKKFKSDFFGSSPAPFIGRFGYPDINVGILSPQFSGDTSHYDSPKLWSKGNFKINTISDMRYGLVNSRSKANVKNFNTRFMQVCQEVGMASKSVELEVNLNKSPSLNYKTDREIMPFGPQAQVKKAIITTNPKIDTRVERVVSDTDLKSVPAILSLYKKGFEESFLNKVLSVGNLGIGKNRKLVPTRWSITAVDDTIGKDMIKKIRDYPAQAEYKLYFGGGWGNYFLTFFFPEVWSYELFEIYLNKKVNPWSKSGYAYSTDYENNKGRKSYAEECAGGYYAERLPVLEKLTKEKKQSSVLMFRFITPEYTQPLGVWVCREAVRKSFNEKPITFTDEKLMFKYAEVMIKNKLGFDVNLLLSKSKLLKEKNSQMKLNNW